MEEEHTNSPEFSGHAVDLPAPDVRAEVRQYYDLLKVDYTKRIADIETFLGFVDSAEDLGTRLARLERFVGIST